MGVINNLKIKLGIKKIAKNEEYSEQKQKMIQMYENNIMKDYDYVEEVEALENASDYGISAFKTTKFMHDGKLI